MEQGKLDLLAKRIRTDLDLRVASHADWVQATLDLSAALAEARDHFKADIAFGRWCDESQFDLNKDDRAAYIAFGREAERARQILERTESRSVRLIFQKEFRVRSAAKPQKPKTAKASPKTDAALAAYDALKAAGIEPTREQVAEKAGVSQMPAQIALNLRKAGAVAAQEGIDITSMPKTAQEKIEAAVRKIQKRMEQDYDQRLQQGIHKHVTELVLPMYRQKLELADRINSGKKPFSIEEYRKLLGALHPDSSSVERRTEMFRLVKEREAMLRPPEKDKLLSGDLPKTIEELLARRRKK